MNKTIHDQAREKFAMAMTYAEVGAFLTAARYIEDIAVRYRKRQAEITAEIEAGNNGT